MKVPFPLHLAVLGYPSDHLFGGGFSLLRRLGPEVRRRQGRMAWLDSFYAEDSRQLAAWERDGVELIALNRPNVWWHRWMNRLGRGRAWEDQLAAFRPNLLVVGSGTDKLRAGDGWREKKRICDSAAAQGAAIVMMHQLSEAGDWIEPVGAAADWLAWQTSAHWHQFVSHATRRETEQNFGRPLPGEIIRNNYNVPYDAELPWPAGDLLRMAFVGRFRIHQKGLDLLLSALTDPRLIASRDWSLTLVGGGAMGARLAAEVQQSGLGDRVSVREHTDDIAAVWRGHHLLVMPSRSEGLSLALCEAMLCGRPAVASSVGGTAELLVDGVTGLSCYPAAAHLADRLAEARAAFHHGRLRAMGSAAARHARQVFPPYPEITYVDQLDRLLASRPWKAGP
jgi:glycosyltransferase involved in cell wall biosynthesis